MDFRSDDMVEVVAMLGVHIVLHALLEKSLISLKKITRHIIRWKLIISR